MATAYHLSLTPDLLRIEEHHQQALAVINTYSTGMEIYNSA